MSTKKIVNGVKTVLMEKPFHSRLIASIGEQKNTNKLVKFLLVTLTASMITLEPSMVFAAVGDVTNATNFETMIQAVIGFLTGTIAKSVAVLAVVFLGFMAMMGKLAWDVAGKVILGIILIFSATQIVQLFVA